MFEKTDISINKNYKAIAHILLAICAFVIGISLINQYYEQYKSEKSYKDQGYIYTQVKVLEVNKNIVGTGKYRRNKYTVKYQYLDPNNILHEKNIENIQYSKNMVENGIIYGWVNSTNYEEIKLIYGLVYYIKKMIIYSFLFVAGCIFGFRGIKKLISK